MSDTKAKRKFRSQEWFDNPNNPGMTALYIERYLNQEYTREELQGERPVIGVAQTGSDIAPCNKIHVFLMDRIKAGIRDGGGIPMEFPVHPIQETGKRPTAALDRNLAYLNLVEVLHGYPIDGVVLTTGCDKTTPPFATNFLYIDIIFGSPAMKPALSPGHEERLERECKIITPLVPSFSCLRASIVPGGGEFSSL